MYEPKTMFDLYQEIERLEKQLRLARAIIKDKERIIQNYQYYLTGAIDKFSQ